MVPLMGTEAGGVGAEELREPWRKNETASEAVVGFNLRKALANRVKGAACAKVKAAATAAALTAVACAAGVSAPPEPAAADSCF